MLIKRLVLQISDDVIRVGVISFSTDVRIDVDLGALSDVNELTDTVWAAEYMAGITNIADGLAEAHRFDLHTHYPRSHLQSVFAVCRRFQTPRPLVIHAHQKLKKTNCDQRNAIVGKPDRNRLKSGGKSNKAKLHECRQL